MSLVCEGVPSFIFCWRSALDPVQQSNRQTNFFYGPVFVIVVTIRDDGKQYLESLVYSSGECNDGVSTVRERHYVVRCGSGCCGFGLGSTASVWCSA